MKPTQFDSVNVTTYLTGPLTPVTKTNNAAVTYTASEFLSGLILRDPNGGARTDITPTAAALFAQLGLDTGSRQSFSLVIRNTADAAETITMQGGSGVTISGTATIAQNNSKLFYGVFTGDSALTLYSIGTFVH